VLRLSGGWIELERPGAAAVVIGELGSMAEGARGVSPTDGRTALASACLYWRVSSAVCQSLHAMELPSASGSPAAYGAGVRLWRWQRGFIPQPGKV